MLHLTNAEIAAIFFEMADLLHIQGGNRYRIRSFRRAGRILENLVEPAHVMIRFNKLSRVPNIGEGTVSRVKQILRSGTCDDHRILRSTLPAGLRDMLDVKGIGAKTVRLIWQQLRIGSIDELEAAARSGALTRIPRLGLGASQKILRGIEAWRKRIGRVPFIDARRHGLDVVAAMQELPEVQRIALGGSVRRGRATIGDLDVLVAADERKPISARFTTLPNVEEVLVHGEGRSSVRLVSGQQCDLRTIPPENWGAGLHYFTGAQLHNIAIRARGNRFELKISEKGVFRRADEARIIPGMTEEEIFGAVGLPWIAPELRENLGELEAAVEGRLPRLVSEEDLRGDLHMHTVASDGKGTVEEMVVAARKLGLEYIAITDHTEFCTVANGQDAGRLAAQVKHIREVAERHDDIRVLAGAEVDILPDGSLDLDEELLLTLDWVVASVHSHFDMDAAAMTARIVAAMETGIPDVIGHPSNRRLGHRNANALDLERLLKSARKLDVALEVNGNPHRMDLKDIHCRAAREAGVPLVISTDSHAPEHLARREFGLITARRGWVEPGHVLNTRPWEHLAERRRDRIRRRTNRAVAVGGLAPPPEIDSGETRAAIDASRGGDDAALSRALATRPLDESLRDRVQRWLAEGDDPAVEAALQSLGTNPMQAAFELLADAAAAEPDPGPDATSR